MGDINISGVTYKVKERIVNGKSQKIYYNTNNDEAFIDVSASGEAPKLEKLVKDSGGGLTKAQYKTQQKVAQERTENFIHRLYKETTDEYSNTTGYGLKKEGLYSSDIGETFALGFDYIDAQGKQRHNKSAKCKIQINQETKSPQLEYREKSIAKTPSGKDVEVIHVYAFPEKMTKYGEEADVKTGEKTLHFKPILQQQDSKYVVDGKVLSKEEFKNLIIEENNAKEAQERHERAQAEVSMVVNSFKTPDSDKIKNGEYDSVSSVLINLDDNLFESEVFTKYDKVDGTMMLEKRTVAKRTPTFTVIKHIPVRQERFEEILNHKYVSHDEDATYEVVFKDGKPSIMFSGKDYENSEYNALKSQDMGV